MPQMMPLPWLLVFFMVFFFFFSVFIYFYYMFIGSPVYGVKFVKMGPERMPW